MTSDHAPTGLLLRAEGVQFEARRVVAIDYDARVIHVVSETAYLARDFTSTEQVPFSEALWIP